MLDVIIPVLNEERILIEQEEYFRALKGMARIVFVDGGSSDRTVAVAQNYGEVISSQPGRGLQKNRGAQAAEGDHLLFLQVDAHIKEDTIAQVDYELNHGVEAGCLTMKIGDHGWMFRIYERVVNFRAKYFGIYDGDLGLFVNKKVFEQVGRFDHLPVMEDLIFAKKIRRAGKTKALPNIIYVSSRKWHDKGFLKTFLIYTLAYLQLWTGQLKIKDD
jgi:rSAM/selenodomain-associated transferase 2